MGWLLALCAALGLYGVTMAPDLVWHDAGDYQWQAARLNLVRPGDAVRVHPFFIVLAHGLGQVGLWNYAKAASVASALGTAVAVANVWLIVWLLARRVGPACIAALTCMLAHTIWQQGVQPQTYGWANAAISGMLLAAVAYVLTGRLRYLLLAFLVAGVGISIHLLTQIGLVVLGVWVLVRVVRGRTPAWAVPAAAGVWLLGGALFWYVVCLEYDRTRDLAATLASAFVGRWGEAVFNVSRLGPMLGRSALMAALNFPTPVAFLGLYGIWRARRLLAGTPLAAMLGAAMVLYILFAMRYRVQNQNYFFTPAYLLFAVYIGLGAHALLSPKKPLRVLLVVLAALVVVPVYWVTAEAARACKFNPREGMPMHEVPYRDFYKYYFLPWQCHQVGPRRFAEEVLASLPPGAVLAPDSTVLPPLLCVHDLEHRRPDVFIGRPESLEGRRVFVTSDVPGYAPAWAVKGGRLEPFGLVWEVKPAAKEGGP